MELHLDLGYDMSMWPVIFSLGRFELRTLTIFSLLAIFFAGYFFWRRGREEHYGEENLFDGFVLSVLYGSIFGRVGFIFFNLEQFGLNVIKWIDIFAHPGINTLIFLFVAGLYLYRYALKNRWDVFEVMDFAVGSLCLGLFISWLGLFFDGTGFGVATNLPVGMVFPGVFDKHHPIQLYYTIFYLVLFVYLTRVEYKYRTFLWYRFGKKTAQTGFLTSVFLIFTGAFSFLVNIFSFPSLVFSGWRFDFVLSFALFVLGLVLMGVRSGRLSTKFFGRRNRHLLETMKV